MIVITDKISTNKLFIPKTLSNEYEEYVLSFTGPDNITLNVEDQHSLITHYTFNIILNEFKDGEYTYKLTSPDGTVELAYGLISLGLNYKNQINKVYEPR